MRGLYLLLVLSLLAVGTASALVPVKVTVTSSNPWMVADGSDSAVITVAVTNESGKPVRGADVNLEVPQPWSLATVSGQTGGNGMFDSAFLPTTRSGIAMVTATVTVKDPDTPPVTRTYAQNITAGPAAQEVNLYPGAATLGDSTTISVRILDKHGNPVNSLKEMEQVGFTATPGGASGFLDGKKNKVKQVWVPLDDAGTAATDYVLDTRPGPNFVAIDPPKPLPPTLVYIEGIPDGKPASITLTVKPEGNPPTLSTDGSHFILEYQLEDLYGNPSAQQDLAISTNAGESMVTTSNNRGGVTVTYGPKNSAGKYTVTATAVKNPMVAVTRVLRFASDDPTDMLLTASPQSMASLDVNKDMVSRVTAKVIDDAGNPVRGQTVSFSIQFVDVGAFVEDRAPVIESGSQKTSTWGTQISSVTDENGLAALDFYPGHFTMDPKNTNAEGTAKVRAVWSGVTRDLDLSYKNYPYLSVSTSVDPLTVETGEEVKVTIGLRGDGYALKPKPVDVLLLNDRSGSMLTDYPDRMVVEMDAATSFVDKFELEGDDRMGLLSFGANYQVRAKDDSNCGKDGDSSDDATYASIRYKSDGKTYGDWAVLDLGLSSKASEIKKAISGLVPGGYTPMRYALYKGITEVQEKGRQNAVRALVLMSDGDYNRFGDPLARGTAGLINGDPNAYGDLATGYIPFTGLASQSMADYAKEKGIRIYTIGYGEDISAGGEETLKLLATQTGGKAFIRVNGDGLADVYKAIAGDLKQAAGVNTRMNLDFQTVKVNNKPEPGQDVFEYVPKPGESTYFVPPAPRASYTLDSAADWKADQKLDFDLGTIHVNEEWTVSFVLKVKESGNIKVLGDTSRVIFDDGKSTLKIPDTYLTSVTEGKEGGLGSLTLTIMNLRQTNPEEKGKIANLEWNIAYNGNNDFIMEEITMAAANSDAYFYKAATSAGKADTSGTYLLDVSDQPPGSYKVRVTGMVGDAEPSFAETEITIGMVGQSPRILIR
jgi:hypothetical protein